MAADTHPTRRALLDAGLMLAEDRALSTLSIDEIVQRANVAKGTFYVHFRDRADYMVALHRRFHDDRADGIREAGAGLEPGAEHLRASTLAYLNGCLAARGVKAMLLEARGEPAIAQAVATSNERFSRAAVPDFRALGARHPSEAARLFVAMVAEVALLELPKGKRRSSLRAALWHLAGVS
jgi:TetR/AcrR family transcriptional repressor of nem operon